MSDPAASEPEAPSDVLSEPHSEAPSEARPTTALTTPRDGVPEVVVDERRLDDAAAALAAGSGPVAVDAERASGYRYGQDAYLVQLRREGAGTWLIDPIACPDLSPIQRALGDTEWVLHAATQDLPCLAAVGLHPSSLFDTELGSRLAGRPRVGLGAVVEHYLGLTLAKEHSAADWSTRPLPEPWLRYAALDVEVLVALRDAVAADLQAQGKLDWAREEFAALTSFTGPPPRVDPWRRTSRGHTIRRPRQLAALRELWQAREAIARRRDLSPGRVVSDATLVAMVEQSPVSAADWAAPALRMARRDRSVWADALQRAAALPQQDLPPVHLPATGPPPPRSWADRDPDAAQRLARARAALTGLGEQLAIPQENLLQPETLRRLLWQRTERPDEATVREVLGQLGARPWQVDLATPLVLTTWEPPVTPAESGAPDGPSTTGLPASGDLFDDGDPGDGSKPAAADGSPG